MPVDRLLRSRMFFQFHDCKACLHTRDVQKVTLLNHIAVAPRRYDVLSYAIIHWQSRRQNCAHRPILPT